MNCMPDPTTVSTGLSIPVCFRSDAICPGDVMIVCSQQPDEEQTPRLCNLFADAGVLCSASGFFAGRLSPSWRLDAQHEDLLDLLNEKRRKLAQHPDLVRPIIAVVDLKDEDAHVVVDLLAYLYRHESFELTQDNWDGVYRLADKLDVKSLHRRCEEWAEMEYMMVKHPASALQQAGDARSKAWLIKSSHVILSKGPKHGRFGLQGLCAELRSLLNDAWLDYTLASHHLAYKLGRFAWRDGLAVGGDVFKGFFAYWSEAVKQVVTNPCPATVDHLQCLVGELYLRTGDEEGAGLLNVLSKFKESAAQHLVLDWSCSGSADAKEAS